jgi:uncharacterized protein (UPF0297 family)
LGLNNDCTRKFEAQDGDLNQVELVLRQVCQALRENGYDPVDQIVGYLMSGDPTYITSCQNARTIIRQLERDQILDELVRKYLERGGF